MEKILAVNRKTKEETLRDKKSKEIAQAQLEKQTRSTKITDDDRLQARLRKLAQRENNLMQKVEKRRKHQQLCEHLMKQIMEIVEVYIFFKIILLKIN